MSHLINISHRSKVNPKKEVKLCLVCSSGGHLIKAYQLKPWWEQYEHFWVTDISSHALHILDHERVYYGFFPVQRHLINFIANFFLALRLQVTEKPSLLVSTGAGIAPPFMIVAKLFGCKTIFIETFSLIAKPTLSGKICYYLADHFIVQHPDLLKKYPQATFIGSIL